METKKMANADLIKIQRRTIITLVAILVIILGFFLFLLSRSSGNLFSTLSSPEPLPDAPSKVKKYRGEFLLRPKRSLAVYYEEAGLQAYLAKFKTLIGTTESQAVKDSTEPTAGFKWVAGFYWMMKENAQKKLKYDFCIVPTLVNTDGKFLDYFDSANDRYYNHTNDEEATANPHDQGTLFP